MKLLIKDVKSKPFVGEGGEEISYYWVKATTDDNISISFGTKNDYTDDIGDVVDVEVVKYYNSKNKISWKEVY